MDFRKFIDKRKADMESFIKEEDEQTNNTVTGLDKNTKLNDAFYYDIVNPDTGYRYDIPLLSTLDPEYFFKYVHYMKIRESSPDTFKKILNWD